MKNFIITLLVIIILIAAGVFLYKSVPAVKSYVDKTIINQNMFNIEIEHNEQNKQNWEIDPLSPVFYVNFKDTTGIRPEKAARFICNEGLFTAIQFVNSKEKENAFTNIKTYLMEKTALTTHENRDMSYFSFEYKKDTGYLFAFDIYFVMVPVGSADKSYGQKIMKNITSKSMLKKIKLELEKVPLLPATNPNEDKNDETRPDSDSPRGKIIILDSR